jgi:drug/metabolite transporter (DMT)-like permease
MTATPPSPAPRVAVLWGVLAMLMFSGNFVASRHGLAAGLSVWDLVLLRYAVAGTIFLPVLLRMGGGGLSWPRMLLLAALGGAPYHLLTVSAFLFAPATHGAILNPAATMLFATLLAWWLLGSRPGPGMLAGIALILLGLALIGGASLVQSGGGRGAWIGDLLLVWSGLDWALFGVLLRRWGVDGLRGAAIIGALSLLWIPPHLALLGWGAIPDLPAEAAIQAAYQGLFAGGLAVVLYTRALMVLGPARAALFPPMVPALGVLWAWLLLGERIGLAQAAGMALVVLGMLTGALWRPGILWRR